MDKIKYILIIDSLVVLGTLLAVFFIIGYTQPLVIGSLENNEPIITLPKIDYLLIDNNVDFSSPKTIFVGEDFNLAPGKYYIKILSGFETEIREIDCEINVNLQLMKVDEKTIGIFNVDEKNVEIEKYQVGSFVGSSKIKGRLE